MRPLGPAEIVGVARKGHVSHFLIQCMPISVLASQKNTIYHNILHRELPGFVDTKVNKFYPIMRPLFCSICGNSGNDGRQHLKDIFAIICFFFIRWFYQSILDSDITGRGLFLPLWIIQSRVDSSIPQL